ncbi:MAG: TetR/AcrR family transcriptional regulator [Halobacteriovoraceae bacterium]|nr:TetR/AcrR family transcriptional regulator [Halobacteriovoraceae bacterium]MBT5094773.1 TetR/AcrR family transcriptional regulator [Halobacteriovoraceae bacterium]
MGLDSDKKDSILVEAAKKFAQWGYKKTSIDEIARAAGVAKGTVYLAVKSKDELFYQVLLRESRRWNAEISKNIDPSRPAIELLREASKTCITQIDQHPLIRDFLFGKYSQFLLSLKSKLPALRSLSLTPIGEILKLGIKQGTFKKDLNVEQVANILLDLHVATFLFHMNSQTTMDDLLEREEAAFNLIFNGIKA